MSIRWLSRCAAVWGSAGLLAGLPGCAPTFTGIMERVMVRSGEVVELEGEGGARVLVAPGLNGRILTTRVGDVESAGFVSLDEIGRGESNPQFNNFGGQDRFWIGPEAGKYGIYFVPGGEVTREKWLVPPDLNEGEMPIASRQSKEKLVMSRDMAFTNYIGVPFKVRVTREVGIIPSEKLNEELGIRLPDGLAYCGSYSLNKMINLGESKWEKDKGLLCIWILGQFNAGPRAVVIAPFRPGAETELGPAFNDDYFGRVSVDTPERLQVYHNAVIFRADARSEGKFGISPRRTKRLAGAFDPDRNLLIIVKFDAHPEDPLYASFSWRTDAADSFGGDIFQSYNAGGKSSGELAPYPFFELESVSPCRELVPGADTVHRHATFLFQGDRAKLKGIAATVLDVDLDEVLEAMGIESGA